jgi:hypothetical protein
MGHGIFVIIGRKIGRLGTFCRRSSHEIVQRLSYYYCTKTPRRLPRSHHATLIIPALPTFAR